MRTGLRDLGVVLGWLALAGCGGSGGGGAGGPGGSGGGGAGDAGGSGQGGSGACTQGETRSCYDGPAATRGVGICKAGTQTCKADGTFGACEGQVLPKKEDCSTTEDDDCDGTANQKEAGCVCEPGAKKSCYEGPDGTEGVGLCKAGKQTCADDGQSWGACEDQVTPQPENCSARGDENCDGTACSDAIWDEVTGDIEDQSVGAIAIDDQNNTYVLGRFKGTMALQNGPHTAQNNDVFLAKFDATGTIVWFEDFLASPDALPILGSIAISPSGLIAAGGTISGGTLNFDGTILNATSSTAGFVLLYDAAGNQQGVRKFKNGTGESVYAIAFDASNDLFVGGAFIGDLDCAATNCPTSAGGYDGFIQKFDPTGAELWSRRYGDTGNDYVGSLGVLADGSVLAAGSFESSITLVGTAHPSHGGSDIFVLDVGPNGAGQWAVTLGANQNDDASIAVRPDGGFYLGGIATGPLTVGAVTTGASAKGAFLFSFDANGTPQWAQNFGSSFTSQVQRMTSDAAGNVIFGATVDNGTIDVGNGPITTNDNGAEDAIIAKMAPDGALLWAKAFTGPGEQGYVHVAANASGRIAASLIYENTIDFGLGPHTSSNVDGDHRDDIALVNFQP